MGKSKQNQEVFTIETRKEKSLQSSSTALNFTNLRPFLVRPVI